MARPRRKALKPGNFKTLNVLVSTSAYDYVVSHMDANGFKDMGTSNAHLINIAKRVIEEQAVGRLCVRGDDGQVSEVILV